ncbi:metalloregulator ArsR/SmtB family transcription factor [Rhizobium sp. S95]|uniref:Metalloregulator ArsR/SmtB family transcription factor n=2 Tax=Rhizobiaceae TaxID=82115 RepID=A0AAJ1F9X2_9HYPH|nr:metalloregulator ArsR/SmtB family transcription factor [Ciceribacter sp. S95]MCO5959824.1 metalloregulator ArsR/SmtB family transcription factor [Ciceribacter sp. S101]
MIKQPRSDVGEEILLAAMANPRRLAILRVLRDGEISAGELGRKVTLSQSAASQHLSKLREAGLVDTRRDKQIVYYSFISPKAKEILRVLDDY